MQKSSKIMVRVALFLLIGIFLISLTSAYLPIYPKNLENNTHYYFQINLTSNTDCTGVLLDSNESFTTDNSGVGFIALDVSSLSSTPQRICIYNDTGLYKNMSFSDILLNSGRVYGNITADYIVGNGTYLTDLDSSHITWSADSDFNGYALTNLGSLILAGLTTSQNIVPATDNIYSLGNSTNWFKEIFVSDVYATNINATEVNSTTINTQNLTSDDIDSERVNTENASIGGYDLYKDGGGDLNLDLD